MCNKIDDMQCFALVMMGRAGACVKSKMVYKGCKGMVYRLEIS